ncbi:SDR family NAD(P)-dependent oxidoreductase [Pararhodonellum marinum]|uniref:SDR family NAD(P)-dependent oxidoreductase n=1 Tax=Pararhodonellum marinum TaxID=2755358 RepID=UPI00188FB998|nr:SDR family NAD(P)-dependent oxidoreductase [Pararhodonellum marinum]
MDRNIIITGAAGNLGSAVVEKFKREGYRVIALIEPDSGDEVEEADDVYEVDVTDSKAVEIFSKEFTLQYGELEAIAMLVGGFGMGTIEETSLDDLNKMIKLNFFSSFNMVKFFLPIMKKFDKGNLLMVGAKPALPNEEGKEVVAYSLSKGLVLQLAALVNQEIQGTGIRSHVFVPSVIDTPENRDAMPDADHSKWVTPAEIAESMHFAASNHALRSMTFKLYGNV